MSLTRGSRLGPYEIVGPLGAGGMGEVFRARDTRLSRDVAIKVLPAAMALDPERRARFEREARTVASLSHPHICALFDVGREGDTDFLVMELVDGDTLAARLTRPLAIADTLRIARQLADALAAAHRAGIVHRDLKPGNIMVTKSGVKVLDFGLAKLREPAVPGAAEFATATAAPITAAGTLLGTVPYMAPEQLEGRDVDARADLFAFGAILYEMATGRRAFSGESQASLIAAILDRDPPPVSSLVAAAPPALDHVVQRCLAKDPDERWQSARDVSTELQWIAGTLTQPISGVAPASRPRSASRAWRWAAAALALAAAAAAGVVAGRFSAKAPASALPPPPVHAMLKLPPGVRLSGWGSPVLAFSPDGRVLAIVGARDRAPQQLYLQRLTESKPAVLVPNSEEAEGPFFSPDGEWVAFAVGVSSQSGKKGELRKYSLSSGLTQPLGEIADFFGGAWRADGTIFFSSSNGLPLQKVPAGGGRSEAAVGPLRRGGKEVKPLIYWPQIVDAGTLLVSTNTDDGSPEPALLDLATGTLTGVGVTANYAQYLPTGHIVYQRRDATVMALPYDPVARAATGPPVAILDDVSVTGNYETALAFAPSGALAYANGEVGGSFRTSERLVRVVKGEITPLAVDPEYFRSVRLSPDGTRVAATTYDGALWIYDLARLTRIKLPDAGVLERAYPAWSPDGTRVAFAAAMTDFSVHVQAADGTAPPQKLLAGTEEVGPPAFTADGKALIFARFTTAATGADLFRLPLDGAGRAEPIVALAGAQNNAALSPDGRWIAYASTESGRFEIVLQSYPALGPKLHVSAGGGTAPVWSRDSRTIYYRKGTQLLAAPLSAGSPPSIGAATVVLDKAGLRSMQPLPDGSVLAAQERTDVGTVTDLHLVVNWLEELKRLAPPRP